MRRRTDPWHSRWFNHVAGSAKPETDQLSKPEVFSDEVE
jgi:hypothetical protein